MPFLVILAVGTAVMTSRSPGSSHRSGLLVDGIDVVQAQAIRDDGFYRVYYIVTAAGRSRL